MAEDFRMDQKSIEEPKVNFQMNQKSFEELKACFPHMSSEKITELKEIDALDEQWKKADEKDKIKLDKLMSNYKFPTFYVPKLTVMMIGSTGSGKSSTGNTLLGRKAFTVNTSATSVTKGFPEENIEGGKFTVVDSPGSWSTKPHPERSVDFYVIVINLASPRFDQETLRTVRQLQGADGKGIISSGRCIAVLCHADSTLRQSTLDDYLQEIKGDPLYEFLTQDMGGRFMAVNNTAETQYEQRETQKALMAGIIYAQSVAVHQEDQKGGQRTFIKKVKEVPGRIYSGGKDLINKLTTNEPHQTNPSGKLPHEKTSTPAVFYHTEGAACDHGYNQGPNMKREGMSPLQQETPRPQASGGTASAPMVPDPNMKREGMSALHQEKPRPQASRGTASAPMVPDPYMMREGMSPLHQEKPRPQASGGTASAPMVPELVGAGDDRGSELSQKDKNHPLQ